MWGKKSRYSNQNALGQLQTEDQILQREKEKERGGYFFFLEGQHSTHFLRIHCRAEFLVITAGGVSHDLNKGKGSYLT